MQKFMLIFKNQTAAAKGSFIATADETNGYPYRPDESSPDGRVHWWYSGDDTHEIKAEVTGDLLNHGLIEKADFFTEKL